MQVLLIAPNEEEREITAYALRQAGMTIQAQASFSYTLDTLHERPFEVILYIPHTLDTLLDDLRTLRTQSQVPLIIICDPLTEDLHCQLLDEGCTLALSRPVSLRILKRYITSFFKREGGIPPTLLTSLELGDGQGSIRLDPQTRTVSVAEHPPQRLTQLEFRLLYLLMTNAGQVIPVDDIIERVWGYEAEGNRDLVRGLVRRLRLKIEPSKQNPRFIQNLPGVGYRFELLPQR